MKLYILGSCSGTEPMPGRHHTAFALEEGGRVYWFDAGENCSYTAHLTGVDLLKVSEIFISHPHMDHVGGLGNLLWNIRKISNVKEKPPTFGDVTVYMPNMETFDGIMSVLKNSEGHYKTEYKTISKKINDGLVFKNNDIEVMAKHNFHLPETENGWESFSFCIFTQNKKIIYSADIEGLDDLKEFLEGGCDLLLMETGHHRAVDVCKEIIEKCYQVKSLYFMHHGRAILYDFEGELKYCQKIFPSVKFCNDGDVFDI